MKSECIPPREEDRMAAARRQGNADAKDARAAADVSKSGSADVTTRIARKGGLRSEDLVEIVAQGGGNGLPVYIKARDREGLYVCNDANEVRLQRLNGQLTVVISRE